jgi:predicted lipoprotein with Yx(FWY)xxD motif
VNVVETITKSNAMRLIRLTKVAVAALVVGALGTIVGGITALGALSGHTTRSVVVSTLKTAKYGTILESGRTVYILKSTSTGCGKSCISIWPQVLLPKGVAKATAGAGVSASKLGVITRANGARQVTYAGKALYWFSYDTARGQVKGNVTDQWGRWTVVVVKPASAHAPTTTTTKPGTTTTKPPPTTMPPTTTTTAAGGGGGGGLGF